MPKLIFSLLSDYVHGKFSVRNALRIAKNGIAPVTRDDFRKKRIEAANIISIYNVPADGESFLGGAYISVKEKIKFLIDKELLQAPPNRELTLRVQVDGSFGSTSRDHFTTVNGAFEEQKVRATASDEHKIAIWFGEESRPNLERFTFSLDELNRLQDDGIQTKIGRLSVSL